MKQRTLSQRVGLYYLRLSLFYLRLVFVTYGELAWSFLLTVEIRFGLFLLTVENRFGLFYLRFPSSGNWIWSFLLTVHIVRKLDLVFLTYGSPTVSKKRWTVRRPQL